MKIYKKYLCLIILSTAQIKCLEPSALESISKQAKNNQETYTVAVYMAADNDLFAFAGRNIKQMQNVGSNDRLKIVLHFDMHRPGQKKMCKRLLIQKNRIVQIGEDSSMDSGDTNTLIDFCKWTIEKFPSDNLALVLWNHGTGIIEPILKKSINPSELFSFNPETRLIELNREVGFLDHITSENLPKDKKRGICFDDTTGNYLTNKRLKEALHKICKEHLKGKKLAILACDACLMSMVEVASPLRDYVDIFVGSQEVELGTGYNYTNALSPFTSNSLSKHEFASHIVKAYKDTYGRITNDYTQSALDLSKIEPFEKNIDELSKLLIFGLKKQKNRSVKEAIRISRHKNFCTYFDEPTFIDVGHLYANMLKNIGKCTLGNNEETNNFRHQTAKILQDGLNILSQVVIANAVGKNLKSATGVSIYFPEYHIHGSYVHSDFARNTNWHNFLKTYLNY